MLGFRKTHDLKPVLAVLLACLFLTSVYPVSSIADDEPYYPYGGGGVWGQILGFNWFNELIPIVWADVFAYQDSVLVNHVSSMGGGYYAMFLPVGWYNLTVEEPGYVTKSMEIFVSSGSSTSINFVLELSFEPIHKPKPEPPPQYIFRISVSGLPDDLRTPIYVDLMKRADIASGETIELIFDHGSIHNVSTQKLLEKEGAQYVADPSSLIISQEGDQEFKYTAEYLLTVSVEPENVPFSFEQQQGWYAAGAKTSSPTAPPLIEGEQGIRYRLKAWSIDGVEDERSEVELTMDRPHTLKAIYTTEYYVQVSSPYGTPTGSGWYSAGSTATISIQPQEGFIIRKIFTGWFGDHSGVEPTASLTVNSPMNITAIWSTDYTFLLVLLVLVIVALAVVVIVLAFWRRKAPSQNTSANRMS